MVSFFITPNHCNFIRCFLSHFINYIISEIKVFWYINFKVLGKVFVGIKIYFR